MSLWSVFFLTFLLAVVSIAGGFIWGRHSSRRPDHEADSQLGTLIAASLGLLAFMLAITFGGTTDFLQKRRQLLLEEVNAIGTAYLRTDLLPEPHRSELKELLRKYVGVRVKIARQKIAQNPNEVMQMAAYAQSLQDAMWRHAVEIGQEDEHSVIDALFIYALNDMIDLQTSRLTAFRYNLPLTIWYVLMLIAIVSLFMVGYQTGVAGRRSVKFEFLLALTFAAVILLITDLDRPGEGYFKVDETPIFELQEQMQDRHRLQQQL